MGAEVVHRDIDGRRPAEPQRREDASLEALARRRGLPHADDADTVEAVAVASADGTTVIAFAWRHQRAMPTTQLRKVRQTVEKKHNRALAGD